MALRKVADFYSKQARRDGYPARSVYKLKEINEKHQVIKPGMHVVELGCSPGSWSLYTLQCVGDKGSLLGLDLTPVTISVPPNATVLCQDVRSWQPDPKYHQYFDVMLSDMAPSTTGQRDVDASDSFDLCARAMDLANTLVRKQGSLLVKLFQGSTFTQMRDMFKRSYKRVHVIKPASSRSESVELFLLGKHRIGSPNDEPKCNNKQSSTAVKTPMTTSSSGLHGSMDLTSTASRLSSKINSDNDVDMTETTASSRTGDDMAPAVTTKKTRGRKPNKSVHPQDQLQMEEAQAVTITLHRGQKSSKMTASRAAAAVALKTNATAHTTDIVSTATTTERGAKPKKMPNRTATPTTIPSAPSTTNNSRKPQPTTVREHSEDNDPSSKSCPNPRTNKTEQCSSSVKEALSPPSADTLQRQIEAQVHDYVTQQLERAKQQQPQLPQPSRISSATTLSTSLTADQTAGTPKPRSKGMSNNKTSSATAISPVPLVTCNFPAGSFEVPTTVAGDVLNMVRDPLSMIHDQRNRRAKIRAKERKQRQREKLVTQRQLEDAAVAADQPQRQQASRKKSAHSGKRKSTSKRTIMKASARQTKNEGRSSLSSPTNVGGSGFDEQPKMVKRTRGSSSKTGWPR